MKRKVRKVVGVEVDAEGDHRNVFITVDGERIARHGWPDTKQADTWISLEPGWRVLDDGKVIKVIYEEPRVQ